MRCLCKTHGTTVGQSLYTVLIYRNVVASCIIYGNCPLHTASSNKFQTDQNIKQAGVSSFKSSTGEKINNKSKISVL